MTNTMFNIMVLLIVFSGSLLVGVIGLGLFKLLPKSWQDKIENFHEGSD